MAVDRNTLVKDVLGQDQKPLYAYVTQTIEGGKYADLNYEWASWPRDKQIQVAQQLFKQAGYGPTRPLQVTISYNTKDVNKKNSLAIASMWQQVFGANAIQVTSGNQEWKTFIQSRHKGDYDIARDGWVADYDNVDAFTTLFICGNPQNNSKGCAPGYNDLIMQARSTLDPQQRLNYNHQAIKKAMENYNIIPLYQDSYYRLVSPKVKNYQINNNHLDHVLSKWYKF
jgi:oligopeptide transport system substrate-binding protein